MSSVQSSSDVSLVFFSLREKLARFLPESSERAQVLLQSSGLMQVSYATLKNFPYAFLSKELGAGGITQILSTRVTYIESAMIAVASTVCNLAFLFLYAGLCTFTLGLSSSINFSLRKHWHHVTYGLVATGISLVGVVAPSYGVGLNGYLLYVTLNMMKRCYGHDLHLFERPLLKGLQDITRNFAYIVKNYTRERVKDLHQYLQVYKPTLEYIEEKIHTASRMDDLVQLALEVRSDGFKVGFPGETKASAFQENKNSRAVHRHYAASK